MDSKAYELSRPRTRHVLMASNNSILISFLPHLDVFYMHSFSSNLSSFFLFRSFAAPNRYIVPTLIYLYNLKILSIDSIDAIAHNEKSAFSLFGFQRKKKKPNQQLKNMTQS